MTIGILTIPWFALLRLIYWTACYGILILGIRILNAFKVFVNSYYCITIHIKAFLLLKFLIGTNSRLIKKVWATITWICRINRNAISILISCPRIWISLTIHFNTSFCRLVKAIRTWNYTWLASNSFCSDSDTIIVNIYSYPFGCLYIKIYTFIGVRFNAEILI